MTSGDLSWPQEIGPVYVVSIRPERFLDLKIQMEKWGDSLNLWNGTDGNQIDKNEWILVKKKLCETSTMKRGEIGCFDSHYRLWNYFLTFLKSDFICIIEDDVDLKYDPTFAKRLLDVFKEALEKTRNKLELFYFIHDSSKSEKPQISQNLQYPRRVTTMGYVLSRSGAEILIKHAIPFNRPVDCYMEDLCDKNEINALAMYPALTYVRDLSSDTQNIV